MLKNIDKIYHCEFILMLVIIKINICPNEVEEGNIEYKRYFNDITMNKLYHLTAQMNWRMNEGNGVCHYYIGICDNGDICTEFTQEKLDYSLDIIKQMVAGCNACIDNIILNRIGDLIWLDITIQKKYEHMTEYRILSIGIALHNIIPDYKYGDMIVYNTIVYNNEKYLFFECTDDKYINMIDFNLVLYTNTIDAKILDYFNSEKVPVYNTNTIFETSMLMSFAESHVIGNNIYTDDDIIFNIIHHKYTRSIGHVLSGYLKKGKVYNGLKLYYNNIACYIISIHSNRKDCDDIIGPATVSLRIRFDININQIISGKLTKHPCQNEAP